MPLKTTFLRDAERHVIGTVVRGFGDGSATIRNRHGRIIGHVLPPQGRSQIQERIASPGPRLVGEWTPAGGYRSVGGANE